VAFLTTVPVGTLVPADGHDLARAGPAFPAVGAAIGCLIGAAAIALIEVLPPLAAAGAALAIGALLTGAMHLDALADTADALGARTRDEALRIMRDPNTGSFGTVAVALSLLIEAAALAQLAEERALGVVVATFAISRAVAPALACLLPYARPGVGLARSLAGGHCGRAAAAVALAVAVSAAVAPRSAPGLLLAAGTIWILSFAGHRWRFGGVTGDTLGASIALTEALCLVLGTAG
jgi:cobalamin 5'-phosphate synthase/cobalamin synthase